MKNIYRAFLTTAAVFALSSGAFADNYGSSASANADVGASLSTGQIQDLQEKLTSEGYSVGPADGVFGARTSAALRQYQQDNNLSVNGQASSETMNKLNLSYYNENNRNPNASGSASSTMGNSDTSYTNGMNNNASGNIQGSGNVSGSTSSSGSAAAQ